MIMESEQRRREMSRVYNSYTAARSKYSIDDIPMPDSLEGVDVMCVWHCVFMVQCSVGMLSFACTCVG
jgi:hypothetical protein